MFLIWYTIEKSDGARKDDAMAEKKRKSTRPNGTGLGGNGAEFRSVDRSQLVRPLPKKKTSKK